MLKSIFILYKDTSGTDDTSKPVKKIYLAAGPVS